MNELKKNDLVKARKLCNIFRFIDDLNSINDGGEFENDYSNIYPEELQLGKENTDEHEASFMDLNIKIKDGKFHFGLFDKRDSFPFPIVRISDKSSNVPSSIVYSAIGAESLRIARASNNPESFSTAIKPLIARMNRQGVSIGKINSSVLKIFNKHHSDFKDSVRYFSLFLKDKCIFSLFRTNTLKRNLTYSCFFFPLFHEHLFSPGLPRATRLLETSCLEKITVCVIETIHLAACPDE